MSGAVGSSLASLASLASLSLVLIGCAERETAPQLPPIVADLPRVEYRSDVDLDLCPQAPELVQEHIEAMEEALGIAGPSKVRYVHIWDRAQRTKVLGWLGCSASACVVDGDIYSGDSAHLHEVAHAVVSPLGIPKMMLSEGLATAFGYSPLLPDRFYYLAYYVPLGPETLVADWRDLPSLWRPGEARDSLVYRHGAKLVAYLFNEYEPGLLVELYRRARWDASPEEFEVLFEEIYGEPIDTVWGHAQELPAAPMVCVGIESNVSLDGEENVVEEARCVGTDLSRGHPTQHVWELAADEPLAMTTTYRRLLIGSCDIEQEPLLTDIENSGGGSRLILATWPRGKYFSGVVGSGDDSFRVRRGSFLGRTCDEVEPLPLETAPESLEIHMVPRLDGAPYDAPYEQWAAVEWLGEEPLVYSSANASRSAFVCSECDDLNFVEDHNVVEDEWIRDHCAPLLREPVTLPPGVSWILNRGTTTDPELRIHGMALSGLQRSSP